MDTTFLMGFTSVAKATGVMTAKLSSERTMTGYNVVALNKVLTLSQNGYGVK